MRFTIIALIVLIIPVMAHAQPPPNPSKGTPQQEYASPQFQQVFVPRVPQYQVQLVAVPSVNNCNQAVNNCVNRNRGARKIVTRSKTVTKVSRFGF
jgi:hypothetical protein